MKKIVLLLTIALSFALSASAISLKEAFNALSNVPNISVKSDYNTPILGLTANGSQRGYLIPNLWYILFPCHLAIFQNNHPQ